MSFTKLEAQVIIAGLDVSDHVISLKRNHDLCNIVQICTIEFDYTLLDFLSINSIQLQPSNTLVIYEFGRKKFTGHVRSVDLGRVPQYRIKVDGTDLYKYAKDYFISESLGTTNGETIGHWVSILFDLIGLSYVFDNADIESRAVGPGIEVNLRTVDDILTEMLAYASAYVYVDGDGLVHFQKGATPTSYVLRSGINGNVIKASHALSDTNTRNVSKVWGFKNSKVLHINESPYITATESVDLGLPCDKTVLYSSNYIQTQTEADRLAVVMNQALGKFDSVKNIEIVGEPDLFIGHSVMVDIDLETAQLYSQCAIFSIASSLDKEGYIMQVTLDSFCPKFAGWELAVPYYPLYAGTTTYGIYRSLDNGATWSEFNTGLPSGTKFVKKMAYNYLDEGMAIVNGEVYYSNGTFWTKCVLPSPVNTANDNPAPESSFPVSVDSIGEGMFAVLTTLNLNTSINLPSRSRTWLYTCEHGGLLATDWIVEAVHADVDYNFSGIDVNSKNGIPYILTNKITSDYPDVGAIKFSIGGTTLVQAGQSLSGTTISSRQFSADEEIGIVPKSRASLETSRILYVQYNPTFQRYTARVRLVLGHVFPRLELKLIAPNNYFRPFIGLVGGRSGKGGIDNSAAAFGGYYLTREDILRGHVDVTVSPIGAMFTNELGGVDYCFYIGVDIPTPYGTHVGYQFYFNEEPLVIVNPIFEGMSFEPEYAYNLLHKSFNLYPFNLNNLRL